MGAHGNPRMRRFAFQAVFALSLLASRAGAALVPFEGTIEIDLSGIVTSFAGAGIATIDDGDAHVSSIEFTSGSWQTSALVLAVTDPSSAPIRGIQITAANGAGAFAENGGGTLVGAMPMLGAAKVCLFGACGAAVANLTVPLHVIGVGGRVAATGLLNVTVEGAPWTTGTAVNFVPYTPFLSTRMGGRHGPASMTSSTAVPGGSIQLVTPYRVWTNLGVDQPSVFGFVTATLRFVPEPTTLGLLSGGCAWLGLRARRCRLTRRRSAELG